MLIQQQKLELFFGHTEIQTERPTDGQTDM